ncbi:MAG: hypothetical protein M1577_03990 [Chloroflexi bacterium]|nr:hypothetical protein [Chloroflexota bacterium]
MPVASGTAKYEKMTALVGEGARKVRALSPDTSQAGASPSATWILTRRLIQSLGYRFTLETSPPTTWILTRRRIQSLGYRVTLEAA